MILMMIQTHRGGFPVVPEVGSLGRGVLNDPDDDPNTTEEGSLPAERAWPRCMALLSDG